MTNIPRFLPLRTSVSLKKILRAGLEAPSSSYNMQPWRFVVVRDPEQRKRLRLAAMNQEQVEQTPVVIVACGDTIMSSFRAIQRLSRSGLSLRCCLHVPVSFTSKGELADSLCDSAQGQFCPPTSVR